MKVVILGCGPAGLIAAKAARDEGAAVVIASKKRKSELFGAQYLHEPISDIDPGRGVEIVYTLEGTADAYRKKVYGNTFAGAVSPETLEENHKAWDIRHTYDKLWEEFEPNIVDGLITPHDVAQLVAYFQADLFLSTIPAPLLCHDSRHEFPSERVWALGDAPERGQKVPFRAPPNTVICNGQDAPAWYRLATIFGHTTAEWPWRSKPPLGGVAEVVKPLASDCNCWEEKIKPLGRYGKWQKGALSHEAYNETVAHMASVQLGLF